MAEDNNMSKEQGPSDINVKNEALNHRSGVRIDALTEVSVALEKARAYHDPNIPLTISVDLTPIGEKIKRRSRLYEATDVKISKIRTSLSELVDSAKSTMLSPKEQTPIPEPINIDDKP